MHTGHYPTVQTCAHANRTSATHSDRRAFLKACGVAAAAAGLDSELAAKVASAVSAPDRPPVVWLHFQECTGCTESLLRTSKPAVQELILELISLDYHETLAAAAGHQLEENLHKVMTEHDGAYILVVEGAIPTKDGGIYCKVGGKTAAQSLEEAASKAAAVIAIGSCASFGGVAAAPPNPTGAVGVPALVKNKAIITLPGCPPNPYNLLSTVLHYLTFGKLPALDDKGRPLFAYGRTIHEHCPRRPHFDAGRFAEAYGDDGHRAGWCLYELGCKGPQTYASCSTNHFCEVVGAWPIGIGHPCVGCTEDGIAFRIPMHDTIDIPAPTSSANHAPIEAEFRGRNGISPISTGFAGLVGGVLIGIALMAAKELAGKDKAEGV